MNNEISDKRTSVTAAICTCNRAGILKKTLDGINKICIPETIHFKVIVVDNNSEDETHSFVNEFKSVAKCEVIYVKETKQGLSHARNRGIRESDSDYIIFWDDDAIPFEDYLVAFQKDISEFPDIKVFGGKIIGVYNNKPDWFITSGPYRFLGILGAYDLGEVNKVLADHDDLPVGANMIFRKDAFERVGEFNTNMGRRKGTKYILGGEETELINQIKKAGNKVAYLSDTIVHHYVDTSRFNVDYLKRVFIGAGILEGMNMDTNQIKMVLGIPRYLVLFALKLFIKKWWHKLAGEEGISLYYQTRLWVIIGMVLYFKYPKLAE